MTPESRPLPTNRHRHRNERPVEQGGEHEFFRVQTPARDVEHAKTAHQQAYESKVVRGLFSQHRQMQKLLYKVRGKQQDSGLGQDEPAKVLDGSSCRALLFR